MAYHPRWMKNLRTEKDDNGQYYMVFEINWRHPYAWWLFVKGKWLKIINRNEEE